MNKMKRYAKLIVPAIVAAFLAAPVPAATCTSVKNGNWDQSSTWGPVGLGACGGIIGATPTAADDVIISDGDTVTIRTNVVARNVTVGQGINGTLRYDRTPGNFSLTVGNGTAGNGNFTVNAGAQVTLRTANNVPNRTHTLLLQGNFSNGGTVTTYATNGTRIFVLNVTMNGAAAQTLGGTALTTFNDLTINNTGGGVTVNSASVALSPKVNGILTLTSGLVYTTVGTNVLALTTAGTVPGGGSNISHVVGDVQKDFLAVNGSFTFPLGDGTNYQPVTVALTGVTTAGSLTGHVNSGDHPDTIANVTRIDQTNSANHYWTLTPATLAGGSYIATFQFCATTTCGVPAERDTLVPSPPASFIVARKTIATGAWTRPTVGVIAANTIEAIGGVTAAQGFGQFAVGIPLVGVYKGVNQLIDLRELY